MSVKQKYRGGWGFTLVEVIVAVAIMVVILGTFAVLFRYFFSSYYFSIDQGATIDEAKNAVSRIIAELREARTSEEGAYPLVVADDDEVVFYADVDNDDRVERVRYYLSGNSFFRGVVEPDVPPDVYDTDAETVKLISDDVRNQSSPVFYYFNQDWPGDTINNPLIQSQRLLDTRLVRIELDINTNPTQQSNFKISNQVMLRNLKTN